MGLEQTDVVVFDLGGVVVHWDPDDFFQRLEDSLGIGEDRIRDTWERLKPEFMRGEITYGETLEHLGIERTDDSLSVDQNPFNQTFERGVSGQPFDHTLEVVDRLRESGVTVAIGSNIYAPHVEWVKQREVFDRFNRLYLSCELGAAKPSKKFFEHILEDLGVEPDRTIFMDDPPENVEGARSLGIRAFHYEARTTSKERLKKLLREV